MQAVTSINLSKEKIIFVPLLDFSKSWTEKKLYEKYNLSRDEIDLIDSMIKPMEVKDA
jgi:site-specific DNA-methyltransferase (adenine-specific)